ncbi:DNA polymerase zeta catalytic subunit [Halocaridina rubra]|uniref:DNA-directed DNA polymerase n=1 Tax=Halocaridina rubra TaxID=373956 RepID=A0AAN9A9N2_HALRR
MIIVYRHWRQKDCRKEPRVGERVPYVVIYGAPGLPLIQLVRSPDVVLADPALRVNATYYITRAIIPPLQRCFSLLGVDVMLWYNELPRVTSNINSSLVIEYLGGRGGTGNRGKVATSRGMSIARYFTPVSCVVCGAITTMSGTGTGAVLCSDCKSNPQTTVISLYEKIRTYERALDDIKRICEACLGCKLNRIDCISLDCPATYQRNQASLDHILAPQLQQLVKNIEK